MWSVRLFSLIRILILLSRRLPLSRIREASVALECETEMNFEGSPVKAAPEAGQKQAHAAKFAERRRHQKPLQQTATWSDPAVDPSEINDREVDEQRREAVRET